MLVCHSCGQACVTVSKCGGLFWPSLMAGSASALPVQVDCGLPCSVHCCSLVARYTISGVSQCESKCYYNSAGVVTLYMILNTPMPEKCM